MTYIVINKTNNFDNMNAMEFETLEEVDAAARQILQKEPGAQVVTAQLIKRYKAEVVISEEPAVVV